MMLNVGQLVATLRPVVRLALTRALQLELELGAFAAPSPPLAESGNACAPAPARPVAALVPAAEAPEASNGAGARQEAISATAQDGGTPAAVAATQPPAALHGPGGRSNGHTPPVPVSAHRPASKARIAKRGDRSRPAATTEVAPAWAALRSAVEARMHRDGLDWAALGTQVGYSATTVRIGLQRRIAPATTMTAALQRFAGIEAGPDQETAPEVGASATSFRGGSTSIGAGLPPGAVSGAVGAMPGAC